MDYALLNSITIWNPVCLLQEVSERSVDNTDRQTKSAEGAEMGVV
jgi:hypothetical protein